MPGVRMWWIGLSFLAGAWAKSPCAALKPKAELDPAAMSRVTGALQSAMSAAGVPGQVGTLAGEAARGLAGLGQDQGARDWTLYQICTLKESGLLSAAKAEEMAAAVVAGAQPAAPAPRPVAPPPIAATPTIPVPVSARVPPPPPGFPPLLVIQRNDLARNAETACATMPSACGQYLQLIADFDARAMATVAPAPAAEPVMPPDVAAQREQLETTMMAVCAMPDQADLCEVYRQNLERLDANWRILYAPARQ